MRQRCLQGSSCSKVRRNCFGSRFSQYLASRNTLPLRAFELALCRELIHERIVKVPTTPLKTGYGSDVAFHEAFHFLFVHSSLPQVARLCVCSKESASEIVHLECIELRHSESRNHKKLLSSGKSPKSRIQMLLPRISAMFCYFLGTRHEKWSKSGHRMPGHRNIASSPASCATNT